MARPGGSTHSTKVKPTVPKAFVIAHTPRGWRVKQGDANAIWRHAREISLMAMVITQPNGELRGIGVVERNGDVIRITA